MAPLARAVLAACSAGGFFFCPGLVSGFYSFGMHGMAWWGSMRARWRVLFLAVDAECSVGGYAADMSW